MDNIKLTADKTAAFLKEASRLGCYSTQQAGQIEGVWNLIVKLLNQNKLDPTKITVEDLLAKSPDLFRAYGATTNTKLGTIQTYGSRLKAFLVDFTRWNGGDFMAWKEQNAKKAAARPRKAKTAPGSTAGATAPDRTGEVPGFQSYDITAGPALLIRLSIAQGLKKDDLDHFWKKLTDIKSEIDASYTNPAPKDPTL